MATKLQRMTELAAATTAQLTGSVEEWQRFLDSAAWLYKYPWHEQVMIYAQRPDAKACAPIELWNNTFRRWVNKGAKGIALIDDSGEKPKLRYVFDVSDTNTRYNIPFRLWEPKEQQYPRIIEELGNRFGESGVEAGTFPEQLMGIVINVVSDNYKDYERKLLKVCSGSALDSKEDTEIGASLLMLLLTNVSHTVMVRLGIDPKAYFKGDEYAGITAFNTPDTIALLGTATGDISEMILRQIERSVRSMEREERDTLANARASGQNEDRNKERSNEHGTGISAERGLSDSQPDHGRAADGEHRQVRADAEELPHGEPKGILQQPAADRQTDGAPDPNRQDGERADRPLDGADGEGRGRDRKAESGEPDGMGAEDEQHSGESRGSSDSGDHLRLTDDTPLEAESEQLPAFLVEERINGLLQNARYMKGHNKDEITAFFASHADVAERMEFLRDSFEEMVYNGILLDGEMYGYQARPEGLLMWEGNYLTRTAESQFSWSLVHDFVEQLIERSEFTELLQGSLFPTENEQLSIIEQASEKPAAISIAELDHELLRGSGFADGKYRIYAFYQTMPTTENAIAFLKKEYGIGGHSHTLLDGTSAFADHDGKGIRIWKYRSDESKTFSWRVVHGRLQELIRLDRYLTEKEKAGLPAWEQEVADRKLQRAEEAAVREQLRAAAAAMDEKRKNATYRYSLGDEVQLGAQRYTILGIYDDTVMLSDPKYPLLSEDMSREVFERRLRENPANDHFIAEEKTPEEAPEEVPIKDELPPAPIETATEQTVAFYPAEENHLPYDIEIRTLKTTPEPAKVPKHDFRITDDNLGHGGAKAKFRMNMDAIKALQAIEAENRLATPEEQETLSRYVGWGGIPQAFDETNASWADEYRELRAALTEEEYTAARESTLNAHYTSPVVIKAMYQALENMGFKTGNILEPSCGIGNFFGLLPETMKSSKLYGVELDSITGRIAKQLYQTANIAIQGFEDTSLPDSFFDVAIGNVPFGNFGVADKRYDKNHFLIHDYFFAKTLDKVRPGGVIAFITFSGTMDKKNPDVRRYIAERAELLGAIRLPNDAFLKNAGTQVVADILFLQKRDRPIAVEPDWVHLGKTEDGFTVNRYFVDNPDMVLGELTEESTQYGRQECTVRPIEGADLGEQLKDAIANIHGDISEFEREEELSEDTAESIPADPDVRNYSYTLLDGSIYYRENSLMRKVDVAVTATNRIKGMIEIRDCTRRLIQYQLDGYPDDAIADEQQRLNILYDKFTQQYGLINSRANKMAFADDSSYCLLCALEVIDENGNLERKSDMFTKRTIRQQTEITVVDTAAEALAISLGEKATIDLSYMAELTGKTEDALESELTGVMFRDFGNLSPDGMAWAFFDDKKYPLVPADEFLSGNVRAKLKQVSAIYEIQKAHNTDEDLLNRLRTSMDALQKVQPNDLTASEIDVRLGATWLPERDIEAFLYSLLQPAHYLRSRIKVHYSQYTAVWNVEGKNLDYGNVAVNVTYGTKRVNAYKIIEETLNLKDVRVFDTVQDENGNEVRVLNKKETILAQQRQQLIKDAFRDWIWKDPDRRERLVSLYNEKFNSVRPREYDGSHIRFVGMNPEITLRPHQVNAIARTLYGGNALLAHVVGAGKTFEMVASAMESKRLGLCQKSLFVVPNHLTEQWASEFLQLYPAANILVATKRDFETHNRKKFCSRIATGDYDAVIIGHSQFEKIPLSLERQKAVLEEQLNEIMDGILEAKASHAERFTVKQLEKTKKSIKLKLDKLNDQSRKDDVITFEELGVDRLFVDEAHFYKNLFLMTKMRNVAGLSQTEAQKSTDLFMKCRYMDELTGGRGIVFATGTPISNSMTEMYTMQRYLQYDLLKRSGLAHFDAWASTFGETITAIELAPEGTGYRAKTRFARFYNLPELISMFKQTADVQTADMLNLPVPEVEYRNVALKPSKHQQDIVSSLAERAEKVRNGMVEPTVDNMLKITNDGRKLALDQRLVNEMLPDDENSKVNVCVENIHRIWKESQEQRLTQLVFCDLSTPKEGANKDSPAFQDVYHDLKAKLMAAGIPEREIAYIHDAKTETQKASMFANVRSGHIRVLIGSTAKMGAGTNVQRLLKAEHHLDIPWRPSDIEQREGRMIRQGNMNQAVAVYRYVTENTFDAYMWQTIEAKQKFIGQIMTSKSPVRSCEDVDETALSYAEVKALATGNPYIKEKMDLEIDVSRLKLLRANNQSQKYDLEDKLLKHYPKEVRLTEERIAGYRADIDLYAANQSEEFPGMTLCGAHYAEKKDAGTALIEICKAMTSPEQREVGSYRGFTLLLDFDGMAKAFRLTAKGALSHTVTLGTDVHGNIQRLDNLLDGLTTRKEACEHVLSELHKQIENAKAEIEKPFAQEEEYRAKSARLAELDALLNMDKKENLALDAEPEQEEEAIRERSGFER